MYSCQSIREISPIQTKSKSDLKGPILVIDDDGSMRSMLQNLLTSNYEVFTAENGEQGLKEVEKAKKAGQPFILIILDYNMPGMNGIEVASKIKKINPFAYILLMTGGEDFSVELIPEDLEEHILLLRKPFSVAEITLLVQYFYRTWRRDRELQSETIQRRDSQVRNAAIVDSALDCIITIDAQGIITEWNPAAEKTFGFSREEIMGKKMSETIVPHHFRDAHEQGMNHYLNTGEGPILRQRIEIVAMRSDGSIIPIELAVIPFEIEGKPNFTAYLRDISAEKDAQAQLSLQSTALNAAANGIIITDRTGMIIWANPAFLDLTGYKEKEIIGQSTRVLKSGVHESDFYKKMWDTILAGEVWRGELSNKRKSGETYIEDMTIAPVVGEDGSIDNFIAIKNDITERIELDRQKEYNERNRRIISYFATSLLGSNTVDEILWDIAYNCISELGWEDAVIYLLDEDQGNLVQKAAYGSDKEKDYTILNPIEIEIGTGIVGSVASSGKTEIVNDLSQDPRYIVDDKVRESEMAVPIVFENRVLGVIDSEHSEKGFFKDEDREIVEAIASLAANKLVRTLSTDLIEVSERKYRSIFESIQDVYAEIDYPEAIISEMSPSIEAFSGFTREELIGSNFSDFVADQTIATGLMQTLLVEGKVNDFEITMVDKFGVERPVSLTVSMVLNPSGQQGKVVGTMRDISVRKQAELALQENIKMKTDFVSNVSHELRTPMASILGFSGTIIRDENMDDETKMEFIRIIHEEGQRLTRLIENVLDISRMEAGRVKYSMEPIDLGLLVRETLETQDPIARDKEIKLNSQIQDDLSFINADSDAMRQLVVNLVSNAIKFTESGGSISVILELIKDELRLKVEDSGLGIPDQDLPHIFDKFYRVDREKREDQGTGIGLAIVKEIVEKHDGRVEVQSQVGSGTIFRVFLPALKNV